MLLKFELEEWVWRDNQIKTGEKTDRMRGGVQTTEMWRLNLCSYWEMIVSHTHSDISEGFCRISPDCWFTLTWSCSFLTQVKSSDGFLTIFNTNLSTQRFHFSALPAYPGHTASHKWAERDCKLFKSVMGQVKRCFLLEASRKVVVKTYTDS